jgi:hypothetical protein
MGGTGASPVRISKSFVVVFGAHLSADLPQWHEIRF